MVKAESIYKHFRWSVTTHLVWRPKWIGYSVKINLHLLLVTAMQTYLLMSFNIALVRLPLLHSFPVLV